jgi:hypothetical protein
MVGISNFFVKCKKSALENSFWSDIKYKDLVKRRRGQCLSTHTASALSDDDVLPVQELSHFWGATVARGETPVSV